MTQAKLNFDVEYTAKSSDDTMTRRELMNLIRTRMLEWERETNAESEIEPGIYVRVHVHDA